MKNNHVTQMVEDINRLREQMHQLDYMQWKTEALFTWQWWLLVGLTVIPLIIWWKIVDKRRVYEIAFYGCMINIMALLLDDFGTNLLWYNYPIKLIPFLPPLVTADSILVPIILMIVYQRFSTTWKRFFAANLAAAAFLAFVAESVFIWIGYYELDKWNRAYSFLFYLFSTTLARFIILRIKK